MVPPLEAKTTLRAPLDRAPSRTRSEPITLTSASKTGSATDTRTSTWAARWKTTSGRHRLMSSARSGERTSIWWKVRCPVPLRRASARLAERAGGQVVDHVDRVPFGQQPVDEGGPDEAGPPGDEGLHGAVAGQPARRRQAGAGRTTSAVADDREVRHHRPGPDPRAPARRWRNAPRRPASMVTPSKQTDFSTTAPGPTVTPSPRTLVMTDAPLGPTARPSAASPA